MGAKYEDAHEYFLNQNDLKGLVQSSTPIFVVTKMKRLSVLKEMGIDTDKILARQDKRVLVANPPALHH